MQLLSYLIKIFDININIKILYDGINRKVLSVKLYRIMDAGISVRNKMFYDFMDLRFEM